MGNFWSWQKCQGNVHIKMWHQNFPLKCVSVCVCAYFALFLYEFRIVVHKYIFATTPHSMDEWIEENPNRSKLCSI